MNGSLGEAIMRAAVQEHFPEHKFVKARPQWLERLEFDCYNESVGLAFEYQGQQHYDYIPYFHRNGTRDLEAQRERDVRKADLAIAANVTLLEVKYTVRCADIRAFIRAEIDLLGYPVNPAPMSDDEFLRLVTNNDSRLAAMLDQARDIAASHGGRCLSEIYTDCHADLIFECRSGHIFRAPLASVGAVDHQRPRWCPTCGGTYKRTFTENAELAAAATGYILLKVETIGTNRKVTNFHLSCPGGHDYYECLRDNFLPVGADGVPRRSCIKCARARTNQERAVKERADRAALHDLEILSAFAPRDIEITWRCLKCNGQFQASWNTFLNRKTRKCQLC